MPLDLRALIISYQIDTLGPLLIFLAGFGFTGDWQIEGPLNPRPP